MSTFEKKLQLECENKNSNLELSYKEFQYLSFLMERETGVHLAESKSQLLKSRLYKRIHELGLKSFSEYIKVLEGDIRKVELTTFINSLTTNKTDFFRENRHFEYIVESLKKKAQSKRPIYFWSAACSTGEEPYTIALIMENLVLSGLIGDYRILASDLDTSILEKAKKGIYSEIDVAPIPVELKHKFLKTRLADGKRIYHIDERLQRKIKFRHNNLLTQSLEMNLQFDYIFLRNVLIYFKSDTIQTVVDGILKRLRPGGHLIIGLSETLNSITHNLERVDSSIYKK